MTTPEQRAHWRELFSPEREGAEQERLGRIVRNVWIAWAIEQPNPKPSWLLPWEGLTEPERDVDRRIAWALVSVYRPLMLALLDDIERLEAERKRMRAALALFADEANWCDEQWAHPSIGVGLARRALREEAET